MSLVHLRGVSDVGIGCVNEGMVVVIVLEPEGDWEVFDFTSAFDDHVGSVSTCLDVVDVDVYSVEVCCSLQFKMVSPNSFLSHFLSVVFVVNEERAISADLVFVLLFVIDQLVHDIVSYLHVLGLVVEQKQTDSTEDTVAILLNLAKFKSPLLHLLQELFFLSGLSLFKWKLLNDVEVVFA